MQAYKTNVAYRQEAVNVLDLDSSQKVYLCSFGDSRLGISTYRLKAQAEELQIFEDYFFYNELSLPLDFKQKFKDKMYTSRNHPYYYRHYNAGCGQTSNDLVPSRGFGFWCWKAKIILMALEQIKENDLLIYLDIGCELNSKYKFMLEQMLKEVNYNEIMGAETTYPEKEWNKADILDYFNFLHNEEILNSGQLWGGVMA